ncbi:MAG: LamG-like jellyroll fold domain-containing protein, partial [Patescibacteria group bacterium]
MLNRIIKISIITALLFFGVYHYSVASFTISRPSTNNIGLAGHWTFDGKDVVNGVALDSSGNANKGNLVNIATSTFYSAGKIGQGFNFDGTNDYVNIGDFFYSDIFTICAWFKADALAGATAKIIAAKRNSSGVTSGNNEWEFRVEADKFTFVSWNSSNGLALYVQGATTINLNQWYHGCSV